MFYSNMLANQLFLDNPYVAAQKFLEKNDLPLSYLDEVVRFIEKNTAGVSIGTGSDEYVDPFTGKSYFSREFCHSTTPFLLY